MKPMRLQWPKRSKISFSYDKGVVMTVAKSTALLVVCKSSAAGVETRLKHDGCLRAPHISASANARVGTRTEVFKVPKSLLKFGTPNKIWVQNLSGQDIVVRVRRFNTVMELQGFKASLEAGAAGGGVGGAAHFERRQGQVQEKPIAPTDRNQHEFQLFGGTEGACVTAARADDRGRLYCSEIYVKGGHCLCIGTHTYLGVIQL